MEESYAPMQEESATTELAMYIDGTPVEVSWEDNDSVAALKELAQLLGQQDATLTLEMK